MILPSERGRVQTQNLRINNPFQHYQTRQITSCQAATTIEELETTSCNSGFNIYQIIGHPLQMSADLHVKLSDQVTLIIINISQLGSNISSFLHALKCIHFLIWLNQSLDHCPLFLYKTAIQQLYEKNAGKLLRQLANLQKPQNFSTTNDQQLRT